MKNKLHISLFERYLNGELSEVERVEFEERLGNKAFKDEFEEYKSFIKDVEEGAEYSEIINKLDKIHTKTIHKGRIFLLDRRFYVPLSIAATITFLIMIINPMGNDNTVNAEDAEYVQLNNGNDTTVLVYEEEMVDEGNVDDIESDIDFIACDSLLNEIKRGPKGTAFLISEEGYFLTSKHLVEKRKIFRLQNKDLGISFEVKVVYKDSLMDIAILQCHPDLLDNFKRVPYRFYKTDANLGDEVFTLGYPKRDIVYTTGDVSSENGFRSDSLYLEISMPANPGYSGAPLFTAKGDLVGIITANNSKKQSVTYVLKHRYVQDLIDNLKETDSIDVDISRNYSKRYNQRSRLIKKYRPFIFEVH